MATPREQTDKLRAIYDEMQALKAAGAWTKGEFLRLCVAARAAAPGHRGDSGPCGALRRHADPAWLRD